MSKVEEVSTTVRSQIVLASNRATELVWGPTPDEPRKVELHVSLPRSDIPVVTSRDGRVLALVPFETDTVHVYDTATGALLGEIATRAQALSLSPTGRFLITWYRKKRGDTEANLRVWDWRSGAQVAAFHEKNYTKETWPAIRFSDDEKLACRWDGSQVQFFENGDLSSVASRLPMPGVEHVTMAPGAAPYHVALFVPPVKTRPAFVALYEYGQFETAKARKNFFRSFSVSMSWAPDGFAVLVETRSEFSKASYQGDSSLYYLARDGQSASVPFDEGPVHCVEWAPSSEEFVLIAGGARPCTTVFDRNCKPKHDYGKQARNVATYSKNGRFLLIAGFSGMNGTMDFNHRFKKKLLGTTQRDDVVCCEWSPCGRFLMTGTTSPRLRVDNGYALFKYNSVGPLVEVVEKGDAWQLTQLFWLPCPADTFSDRPPSPRGRKEAAEAKRTRKEVSKKSAGVFRARGSTGIVAAMMRADGARKGKGVIKPIAKKGAAGAGAGAGAAEAPKASKRLSKGERKRRQAERKAAEEAEAAAAKARTLELAKTNPSALTPQQRAKRLKQVKKKLRQAEALVKKQAEGAELNADQLKKLALMPELQAECATLEAAAE